MKRTINKVVYDTTKAKELGWHCNNLPQSDFKYCVESLYITEDGQYFLAGEGGAMSRYADYNARTQESSYGKGIVLIDKEEAEEWLERFGK